MARIAISKDYFPAYARLPRKAQRKADEFLVKFQRDSTSAAIHLEPLHRMADPQIRSARIGDDYRLILRAPEAGDVFLLLYADHHDEAYRWAATKQTAVHPATGSLQIFDAELATRAITATEAAPQPDGPAELFAALTDDEIFLAGVPRPLLPSVRAVTSEDELDLLLPHLPQEASEVLTGVAAGLTLDAALEEVLGRVKPPAGAPTPAPVDTTDVAAALERETSQRQFRLLDGSLDLDAALRHPLDVWRVFLHPRQKRLAEARTKGPVRLLGGAGTGKTVVALHRAAFLVREVFTKPDDRVLFTTFTVNLALDLRAQLAKLLEPDQLARVEVVNLDRWAAQYLRSRGRVVRIAGESDQTTMFRGAYEVYGPDEHTLDFCRAEWREVVQEQGLATEEEYVLAVRRHRGVPLGRVERRKIWRVLAAYRSALEDGGFLEIGDVLRAARAELQAAGGPTRYASVVVDETQDLSADALRLVRAIAGPERPDDLFLVGDAHQRIYGRPVSLSSCGIQVRGRRSQTLRLNYRTTGAICRWSLRTLLDVEVDDLDEGKADRRGYVSVREGVAPVVRAVATPLDEEKLVVETVRAAIDRGCAAEGICVVGRTRALLVDRFGPALERASIACVLLDQDEPKEPGVRLATMHRVKGLEFQVVVIVGASKDYLPLPTPDLRSEDPVLAAQALLRERCLLYVAATRARDELYVTATGAPSALLGALLAPRASTPPPQPATAPAGLDTLVTALPLPSRMLSFLERKGIRTVAELAALSPRALMDERNLGRGTIAQTRALLEPLLGRSWEDAGEPVEVDVRRAALAGSWNQVRLHLDEAQRATPLANMELPARVRTLVDRDQLRTLGDLASRDTQALNEGGVGRVSVKDLAAAIGAHFERAEAERAIADLGLIEGLKAMVQQEEPMLRIILTRRAGIGGEAQTLQELGDTFGVSRERIRQLETRVATGIRRRQYAREVERRVGKALENGACLLSDLATDAWWAQAEDLATVVAYVVDDLCSVAHVVEWDGDLWLSRSKSSAVTTTCAETEEAARKVTLPAPLSAFDAVQEKLRTTMGATFADRFAQDLRSKLKVESVGGEPRVVAFGDTKGAEILGLLRASPVPLNIDDLTVRMGSRVKVPEEALYFAPRTIGLEQHFEDFDRWRAELVPAARKVIEAAGPSRQWTCSELLDELREERALPEWMNAFRLASLIRRSDALVYLGRLRVVLPGGEENRTRVFVHEATEQILRDAGGPVTKEDLLAKLHARVGFSGLTLQAVLIKPHFVKVDDDRIGLLDRDVEGGPAAIAEALDQLESVLDRRGRGLSAFHAHEEVRGLSKAHAQWTVALTMSLVRTDTRFRTSLSGAVGLSGWESTRVPTRLDLVRTALDEGEGRVSIDALMARLEAHYGEVPTRGTLGAITMHVGAGLDGEWMVRR